MIESNMKANSILFYNWDIYNDLQRRATTGHGGKCHSCNKCVVIIEA